MKRSQTVMPALLLALACWAVLAPGNAVRADDWPTRPIKFIVTQGAGGTPDLICRLIAQRLSQALG